MDTTETMLVSLDTLVIKEDETNPQPDPNKDILLKRVPRDYMQKNVRNLVVYVADPNNDELNPGYNDREREVAASVKRWMEKAATPGTKFVFGVMAKPANGGEPIPLDLERSIETYKNQIMQSRPAPGQDPSVTLPYMELYAFGKEGGAVLIRKIPLK